MTSVRRQIDRSAREIKAVFPRLREIVHLLSRGVLDGEREREREQDGRFPLTQDQRSLLERTADVTQGILTALALLKTASICLDAYTVVTRTQHQTLSETGLCDEQVWQTMLATEQETACFLGELLRAERERQIGVERTGLVSRAGAGAGAQAGAQAGDDEGSGPIDAPIEVPIDDPAAIALIVEQDKAIRRELVEKGLVGEGSHLATDAQRRAWVERQATYERERHGGKEWWSAIERQYSAWDDE